MAHFRSKIDSDALPARRAAIYKTSLGQLGYNRSLSKSISDPAITAPAYSPIRSHTSVVGSHIRTDAETDASLPESMSGDPLDEVVFQGRTIPLQIYSVPSR